MVLQNVGKTAVMLTGGAIAGFLYVILLPFAWIVAAAVIVMKRMAQGVLGGAAKSTGFGWRPIESYLTGKKKKKQTDKEDQK